MKQGDLWLVDFATKIGNEIDKIRPAVIINNDELGILKLKMIVPITDPGKSIKEWHVPLSPSSKNGLTKKCCADCFQVKSISEERIIRKLGALSVEDLNEVKIGLIKVMDLM